MELLFPVSICCFLLSIWGVIQLILMGLFIWMEATSFIEDVEAHEFHDYDDFISKTKHNYSAVSRNCFITAGIYLIFLGLSYLCWLKAKREQKKAEAKLKDDEVLCAPHIPRPDPKKYKEK